MLALSSALLLPTPALAQSAVASAQPVGVTTSEKAATTAAPPSDCDAYLLHRGCGAPLVWQPGFRRFGWVDGVVTGASLAGAAVATAIGPDAANPRRGGVWFDEDVRDALRSDDYTVRRTFRDASDILVGVNIAYPYVGDALVNAAWYRESPDVAWQMALIDSEALAITLGIQQVVANAVSRERPYGRTCGSAELSADNVDCEDVDRYRSYFSGHTALSFTAATVTCTHHAYLPLHGGSGEWVPCVAGLTLAAATGVARIGADMHYATDVLTGAALGSFVGWIVPWVHYSTGASVLAFRADSVQVAVLPAPGGASLSGVF